MDSVCNRESSVSPPAVLAPVAVKPPPLPDAHAHAAAAAAAAAAAMAGPTEQQRLLYQLALAERLRLASAGLAWARPPLHQVPSIHPSSMGHNTEGSLIQQQQQQQHNGILGMTTTTTGGYNNYHPHTTPYTTTPYGCRFIDPRTAALLLAPRIITGPEEPKPQHSYIGLIAMAILSHPDRKLVLSDIYQYILDNYPYFRSRGPGWRNSIRHNLSLNDCFIKSGRSANGKGHYWAIHPANLDDFRRGDFRRRRAQRRVRKHLGLAVDDDSSPEPSTSPIPSIQPNHDSLQPNHDSPTPNCTHNTPNCTHNTPITTSQDLHPVIPQQPVARKRQFDVASLLAPDDKLPKTRRHTDQNDAEIDVVSDGDDARTSHRSRSPTPAAHDDEDEDEQRPWSLLGWVGSAAWHLPTPVTPQEQDARGNRDPPPSH